MTATTEPDRITAGDTLEWVKSLPSYPASAGWVLRYAIVSNSAAYNFTATASGDEHAISVAAATTAAWAAGSYAWTAAVTLGATRHTVGNGRLTIAPNLSAATSGVDTRSPARQALDAMNTALAAYGAKAYMQSYSIAGRQQTFRNPAEFMALRDKLSAEVAREDNAARIAAGLPTRNTLAVRFTSR